MSEGTISPPVCLSACYVPDDAAAWADLKRRLSSLCDASLGLAWHDRVISNGSDWAVESDPFFESSQIILLLVSPAFLESSYCDGREIHRALRSHEENEARVMPILLESVDLSGTSIAQLRVLPSTSTPIDQWSSREEALEDVAQSIRDVAKEFSNPTLIATDVDQTTSLHRRGDPLSEIESEEIPPSIGRYSIKGVIGEGNYGRVYLAYDAELDRDVAIKAPHLYRVTKPEDVEAYLSEARLVAKLDHPGLVPVYDVGYTLDGRCYVVSKLIEGKDLRKSLKDGMLSFIESARLMADVADALDYAHKRDLVHRDIKPANILIDRDGNPFVADFGMAIREEDYGKGAKYAGTPAYMSPEQARGEGHRVDGRSDVFSLGVVLYELITGRRAFRSHKLNQLLQEIASSEARPPRQIDPGIPRELERICLKAMANRLTERYTTAADLADDLKFFVEDQIQDEAVHRFPAEGESGDGTRRSAGHHGSSRRMGPVSSRRSHRRSGRGSHAADRLTDRGSSTFSPELTASGEKSIRIVPKGLRSFDDQDSSFFLELLPGTRDRDGIPDSLRFWKSRIERNQPDQTFSVGLIYGPSGCGKSSFVRAGLLPLLDDSAVTVFVESSGSDTEQRLLRGLRAQCSRLSEDLDLVDAVTAIRRGEVLRPGKKLLIVLDQFEQWLHGQGDRMAHTTLLDALRQCDGTTVQCLLLVRVDYMMGIHRCMQQLEVRIQEGQNAAAVDLFDKVHARNVLAEFGCAYGRLPENLDELTEDQQAFLEQAVDELADDDKVVQVHLSVFADMLKGRRWEQQTLRALGGAKGIGVKFLEETFESVSAPVPNRLYEKAARAVLKALMPTPGTNIKGGKKSYNELKEISRYADRPDDFKAVIRILDRDLRMITPTDPDVDEDAAPGVTQPGDADRYFELTHDYLVPALREWLTRKQRETRRGRAELRLEERAALWTAKPQHRHLPSPWEYLNIRWMTHRPHWTLPQQKMMRSALRYHGMRTGFVVAALALVVLVGGVVGKRVVANREEVLVSGLVTALENAKIGQLSGLLDSKIAPHRQLVEARLRERLTDGTANGLAAVNFRIAMLAADDGDQQVEPLFEYYMKNAKPDEVAALRKFLAGKADIKLDQLWDVLTRPLEHSADQRFRAASALAVYDKDSDRWKPAILNNLGTQLVSVPRSVVGQWADNLRPIGHLLCEPLRKIYLDLQRSERERTTAADLLARYAPNDPSGWVTLLAHATNREQLNVFVDNLRPHGDEAIGRLRREFTELLAASEKLEGEYQQGLATADDLATDRDAMQAEWNKLDAELKKTETNGDDNGGEVESDGLQQSIDKLAASLSQLDRQLANVRSSLQESNRSLERLASRVANVGVALLHFNQTDEVWPLLGKSSDPRRRSYLIHRIGRMSVDPNLVVDALQRIGTPDDEESLSTCRALVLCLGGFQEDEFANDKLAARRTELDELLVTWFRESPDPGLHSATRWLLLRRNLEARVDEMEAQLSGQRQPEKRWYIDNSGHTMIVFPAGDKVFLMGSPISEIGRERGLSTINDNSFEKRHLRRIEWGFAISATEVTVEQFKEFRAEHRYAEDVSADPKCPINYPTWYDAARYCNWLSEQEGIPKEEHCYVFETRPSIFSKNPVPVIRFPADYVTRKGYRLPTESEWEYCCRAGSSTSWSFGESDALLQHYAWYAGNSGEQRTHAVGAFLPNDWGLFDMYGNVAEWCHNLNVGFQLRNAQKARPDSRVIDQSRLLVTDENLRSIRGGGYTSPAARTRSAARDSSLPGFSYYGFGFRVVRSGNHE